MCLSVLSLVVALSPVSAQTVQPPTGPELVARHDSLVGGRAAYEQLLSLRLLGTFSIPAAGLEAPLEILRVSPNRYLFRTTLPDGAEVLQGFDGRTAWSIRPGQGPRILEGAERAAVEEQANFFGDLHDLTKVQVAASVQDTTFEGRRAWAVRLTRSAGDSIVEYFDQELGLSMGSRVVVGSAIGREERRTLVGDYRQFGPLQVATTIVQRQRDYDVVIRVSFVELDTVRPEDVALPAPVQALIP